MKNAHRFVAAFTATTTIHAALVGALMHSEPIKPSSSKAQEIAMIDIVEPEPKAAKPAPTPPPKPPEKKLKPKPKPVKKTPPKPKLQPKPEPKPEPSTQAPKEEVVEPEPITPEPKIQEVVNEPSQPTASTHRYEVKESYLGRLRQKIQACLRYPMMARRLGLEGKTQLHFTILADGRVKGVELRTSSGHHSLDKRAIATVQEAAPFEAPPEGRELEIILPVSFSLDHNG
jgi:periplasmic protein TonB